DKRLLDPRPVGRDPSINRGLVALGGAAAGTLQTPAEPVREGRPGGGGGVGTAGHVVDDQRDALQRPQLASESAGDRATLQCLLDLGERLVGQAWGGAGRAFAAQRIRPAAVATALHRD